MKLPKYRIIMVDDFGGCHWQAQIRHKLFFWRNLCGSVSSATTAAHEIQLHQKQGKKYSPRRDKVQR